MVIQQTLPSKPAVAYDVRNATKKQKQSAYWQKLVMKSANCCAHRDLNWYPQLSEKRIKRFRCCWVVPKRCASSSKNRSSMNLQTCMFFFFRSSVIMKWETPPLLFVAWFQVCKTTTRMTVLVELKKPYWVMICKEEAVMKSFGGRKKCGGLRTHHQVHLGNMVVVFSKIDQQCG